MASCTWPCFEQFLGGLSAHYRSIALCSRKMGRDVVTGDGAGSPLMHNPVSGISLWISPWFLGAEWGGR